MKKLTILFFLIFGLAFSQLIFALPVLALDLSAEISANPAIGSVPLNDVDLTVVVSGSASGDITYKFDCTSDASWEKTITTSNTSYTAADLCDYSSAGNYLVKIAVERGGLAFQGTTAVLVQSGTALSVALSANPSVGSAPLNDVDLTVVVSGSASGDITYKFDCTSDASWEKTITTSNTSYTAQDLCDYPTAANYIAKVAVERGGLAFQGTTAVVVKSGDVVLNVVKKAKNITKSQTSFEDAVSAEPGDVIEFQIQVSSLGNNEAKDVILRDTLPNLLNYQGNLKINGANPTGDIISGLNIGNLSVNQLKTINFEVKVAPENQFAYGVTNLFNTIMAYNAETANTDAVQISVTKKAVAGAATEVTTGLTNNKIFDYVLLPFALSAVMILLFRNYLVLWQEWMERRKVAVKESWSKIILTKKIAKIKKHEGFNRFEK